MTKLMVPKGVDELAKKGSAALKRIMKSTTRVFNDWWDVADGIEALQVEAMNIAGISPGSNRPPAGAAYSSAMGQLLQQYGYNDLTAEERSLVMKMQRNKSAIVAWHQTLPDDEKRRTNHPKSVFRKWQGDNKPPKPEGERKPSKKAELEAELAKAQDENHDLKAHIAELEAARDGGVTEHGARDPDLAAKLEPLLEGLFVEGKKNMATACPPQVAHLVALLERALIDNRIVPPSKRAKNPVAYARAAKAADRKRREAEALEGLADGTAGDACVMRAVAEGRMEPFEPQPETE
jgi:hypothetical protein